MKSHIALISENGELALQPDSSISIEEQNPLFGDVEMHSYPFELPLDLNRKAFKNVDARDSKLRPTDVDGMKIRAIIDGIPYRHAVLHVQQDQELDKVLPVNLDSRTKSFRDMIKDLQCRDVPVDDDIVIGEKICDVTVDVNYMSQYKLCISGGGKDYDGYEVDLYPVHMTEVFQPLVLGYSYPAECYEDPNTHEAEPATDQQKATKTYQNPNKEGGKNIIVKVPRVKTSYINVSQPYPLAKYCNTRIAYAHHKMGIDSDGNKTGETDSEIVPASDRKSDVQEDKSPYWVLPADRPASGICFYVAYFLERLFKYLGVGFDMTALTNIEDFNYLAFVTTQCHTADGEEIATLDSEEAINKWLDSRGCGGKITFNDNLPESPERLTSLDLAPTEFSAWRVIGSHWQPASTDITSPDGHIRVNTYPFPNYVPNTPVPGSEVWLYSSPYYNITSKTFSAKIRKILATSDNFPDKDVSSVIEGLENMFGVRFVYDPEINKVTVCLLRDVFRSTATPIHLKGQVLSMRKISEKIKGVNVKFSAEEESKEQRNNVRYGVRDYDTSYNYIDYNEKYTKFASYDDVTQNIDVGNRNGYCDLATGDFFRIKVASDASTVAELRPTVFEVGQFKGVEDGDCSQEAIDDGYVKELTNSFEPVMVNDVTYRGKNYHQQEAPLLVPYIDEDMEREFLIKKMLNPVSTKWGSVEIVYELCMAECYEPTKTDDGSSPLQTHDWGLTIGFLRLGNIDEQVKEYERDYDGFDNSKWLITSKDYAITADTFDEHGTFLGTSPAGSFSLKPRAWKPFLYYIDRGGNVHTTTDLSLAGKRAYHNQDPALDYYWTIPCKEDEHDPQTGAITARLRSRGWVDTFLSELIFFLLNRTPYKVKMLCETAQLADLPRHWLQRFEIDGKIGWINKVKYNVGVSTGIGEVEIEFYAVN